MVLLLDMAALANVLAAVGPGLSHAKGVSRGGSEEISGVICSETRGTYIHAVR
jgi:hypothetical protein